MQRINKTKLWAETMFKKQLYKQVPFDLLHIVYKSKFNSLITTLISDEITSAKHRG